MYNEIGNIESVTSGENTINFGYTDTAHPDRLTSYNGKAITYNANGGVATYDGWNYNWNNRGKLASITTTSNARAITIKPILSSSKTYSFTYNALGQRTTSNYSYFWVDNGLTPIQQGEVTNYSKTFYYDHSGRLISETISKTLHGVGNESESIVFLYDESSIIGMVRTASGVTNAYYFQRNLLGDVVAIYDTNGAKIVEYAYDAWGNCSIKGTTTNYIVAHANPIRYRGYYYDEDTKLYYLNARYYSPEFRRFISPDDTAYLDPESVNGLNLYCYCNNDPVNFVDPSGHNWYNVLAWIGLGLVAAAATVLTLGAFGIAVGGAGLLGTAIYGAAVGTLIGAGVGIVGGAVGGMIYDTVVGNDFGTSVWAGIQAGFGIGAIAGAVIGGYVGYAGSHGHSVYISKSDGTVNYVGRTNDIARRTAEHARAGRGIVPKEVASRLTLKQARGLEQALINKYGMIKNGGTLLNRINSIATSNSIYTKAVRWGDIYIKFHPWKFI